MKPSRGDEILSKLMTAVAEPGYTNGDVHLRRTALERYLRERDRQGRLLAELVEEVEQVGIESVVREWPNLADLYQKARRTLGREPV